MKTIDENSSIGIDQRAIRYGCNSFYKNDIY